MLKSIEIADETTNTHGSEGLADLKKIIFIFGKNDWRKTTISRAFQDLASRIDYRALADVARYRELNSTCIPVVQNRQVMFRRSDNAA